MTILVTGIAGFIGSSFGKRFKKKYPEAVIVGIDDFSSGRREELPDGIEFYEGSITDTALLEKIFSTHKPEYVFHFAAIPRVSYSVEHPVETTDVNVTGTVTLLTVAKDHAVNRFIYSSSSSIYGPTENLPTRETEPANPQSPYALQKYTGEVLCSMWSKLYNLDTVSLRYHNVFGPGQYGDSAYSNVVAAWLTSIYFPEQKKGFIEGDGEQAKDMTFVNDIVDANILTMNYTKKFNGEAFNLAIGEKPLSINKSHFWN